MSLDSLAGRRVLVTGATGFLGANLCQRLGELGAEVHGTSRSGGRARPAVGQAAGIRWSSPDLEDFEATRALLETVRPGIVYHFAGAVSAGPDRDLVLPTVRSLLLSSVHVLAAAAELGETRVVLPGSLTEPSRGCGDAAPASPYAAAKWATTAYMRMFHQLYDTPALVVRPFMTYGPGQSPKKLVPHVIRSLLDGQAPALSGGHQKMDWIYIDDVVEGLLLAGTVAGVEGRNLDLGSGRLHSVREVVAYIVELLGSSVRPEFGAVADRPHETFAAADTEEAHAALGWRAQTPLEQGLARTIEFLSKGG